MEIISCLSAKGGVAKTTTILVLAGELSRRGKRVLIIDADTQGSLSKVVGVAPPGVCLGDLLLESPSRNRSLVREAIVRGTPFGDLILPGSDLKRQEQLVAAASGRELRLWRAVESLANEYDYLLVDVGRQGLLTANAVYCATGVLVAVETALLGVEAIAQTFEEISEIRNVYDRGPQIIGVLPTKYLWNRSVHNAALEAIRAFPYQDVYPHQESIPVLEPLECLTAFEKLSVKGLPIHQLEEFTDPRRRAVVDRLVDAVLDWKQRKDSQNARPIQEHLQRA